MERTELSDHPAGPGPTSRGGLRARRGRIIANVLVICLVTTVASSLALLAAVHIDDRYLVSAGFVEDGVEGGNSSVWMALARSADRGVLYPPLFDGEHWGGTRYAPLPMVLWGGVARFTGEYLIAGKVVAYVLGTLLLSLTVATIRHISRSWTCALLLTATIVVTVPGVVGLLSTPRGDTQALLLQLAAVALIARRPSRGSSVAAGALCAFAVASKVSGLWGPLAIVTWMVFRDRRHLPAFLVSLIGVLTTVILAVNALSNGRMVSNIGATLLADTGSRLISLLPFVQFVGDTAQATAVLVPIAVVSVILAGSRRELTVYDLSLMWAVIVLLGVLADGGAQSNHLIDFVVLTPLVTAELWSRDGTGAQAIPPTAAIIAVAAVWGIVMSYGVNLVPDVRSAASMTVGGADGPAYPVDPLAGQVDRTDEVLSEDPYIALSIGKHPTVLDPWIFAALSRERPRWASQLARRVQRAEFDKIVLAQRLETTSATYWDTRFGRAVLAAVCANYTYSTMMNGYWVYEPAKDGEDLASADTKGPNNCRALVQG